MNDGSGSSGRLTPGRDHGFESLMPFRIREVLLVSSLYDSFILQEDGHISELLLEEYRHLKLWYAPRITRCPTGEDALRAMASGRRFDLVVTTMRLGEMAPMQFAREVKEWVGPVPVVVMGYDNRELEPLLVEHHRAGVESPIDRVLVWTADARIMLAMVNLIEDQRNAWPDTREVGVEVIVVVEDSVRFASSFLPMLYTELMRQSESLMTEGVNEVDRVLRMRARPKILWCENYETACQTVERFGPSILGVISDIRFPRNGVVDPEAGFAFTKFVRERLPDLPVLLQSTDLSNIQEAVEVNAAFVHKRSPWLPQEVRRFMLDYFGFGPFVFRRPDGTEVDRAHDVRELQHKLETIPAESLKYHLERKHFSKWLKARTEFALADRLRGTSLQDVPDIEFVRDTLVHSVRASRRKSRQGIVADFHPDRFDASSDFARIGGGSIGGKARGLAFITTLLDHMNESGKWRGIRIGVPPTVVIGTDYFDMFLDKNRLTGLLLNVGSDEELREMFQRAPLPPAMVDELRVLLALMDYPLAVRSSSLLEDSVDQPFAGVYDTFMIPNQGRTLNERLDDLCSAIKLVYASSFSSSARAYMRHTPHRPEMEKMAVIIQRLIGRRYGKRVYPHVSGVASSFNYYPIGRVRPEDGVCHVALGLGKSVVEGDASLRFCPRYPTLLPQFSTVDDILGHAQRSFYALRMDRDADDPHERFRLERYTVQDADTDGTLSAVASTYSPQNHTITPGVGREGVRVVTFANILQHRLFPLPELVNELLTLGSQGMSSPVEIEFAVNLAQERGEPDEFACLQIRPMVVAREAIDLDYASEDPHRIVGLSHHALGNGRFEGIQDIVYIDPAHYDRSQSAKVAGEVAEINAMLVKQSRRCLLIGPGRWGSSDPWLGIPVKWGQISAAEVVVETAMPGHSVEPSEGTHFFHNMTAFRMGYMAINPGPGPQSGRMDWAWLNQQGIVREASNGLRWVHTQHPLEILIDGRRHCGIIIRGVADDTT